MVNISDQIGIFVPARLNSHRLPNKQILPIGNTCMFEICCKKLQCITQYYGINTYVLICDDELLEIAHKYPGVQVVLRDKDTAEAEGPLLYIYKDILDVSTKFLVFLNPCLIFLSVETIVNKIKEFLTSGKDYGTSVKTLQNWVWNNQWELISEINFQRLTTKEIEPLYQCAHCFHIFNRESFKKDGYMLKEDLTLLEIPEEETVDIDTYHDYLYAKWLWGEVSEEKIERIFSPCDI